MIHHNKFRLSITMIFILCFALKNTTGSSFDHYLNKRRTLVIGYRPGAGFFSNFFGVINNLVWSQRHKVNPVVQWGSKSNYYSAEGYNDSLNAWEYYFYPICQETYKPTDKVYSNYKAPDSFTVRLCKDRLNFSISQKQRNLVKKIIDQYIKIKDPIVAKIDSFYESNIKNIYTIGLHLRGTDKLSISKNPLVLIDKANEIAKQQTSCQFYVATDDNHLLELAINNLQGKVIYYDSERSDTGKAIHIDMKKPQLGEDVLIEALLLSKCNILLHTCSNVSSAALCFNPEIKNIFFPFNG